MLDARSDDLVCFEMKEPMLRRCKSDDALPLVTCEEAGKLRFVAFRNEKPDNAVVDLDIVLELETCIAAIDLAVVVVQPQGLPPRSSHAERNANGKCLPVGSGSTTCIRHPVRYLDDG